jgi:hypothetical protein
MPLILKADYRLGGKPRLYLADAEELLMEKVPEDVRKCVGFIQYQSGAGLKLAGTVFFLGSEQEGEHFFYAVTAKHVIDRVRKDGVDGDVYLRLNVRDGGATTVQIPVARWFYHPTDPVTDLAITPWPMDERLEMRYLPRTLFATPEIIEEKSIGVGDEVFMVGLFYLHCGTERNIPIVRVGNIAAMSEEPVTISDGQQMDAYLIEMRSIGGLSGSPVFVLKEFIKEFTFYKVFYLLGLMHGHWDVEAELLDEVAPDALADQPLNTGIGVVVPLVKIIEALDQERLAETRQKEIQAAKARLAPTPDTPRAC